MLTFLSIRIHEMKLYEENINKIRNGGYLYLGGRQCWTRGPHCQRKVVPKF